MAVKGVLVFSLLNQLPGSSVRFIVSTESARVVRGVAAHRANIARTVEKIDKVGGIVFMALTDPCGISPTQRGKGNVVVTLDFFSIQGDRIEGMLI